MDYKKEENKEEFLKFKKRTFSELEKLCSSYNYKTSVLFTYWINNYTYMLNKAKTFESKYLPVYKKGQIIEVELGFNIGHEFGGLHYGVVINNNDKKSNSVLNIIPLSSKKIKNHNEVELDFKFKNELLQNTMKKSANLAENIQKDIEAIGKILDEINYLKNKIINIDDSCTIFEEKINDYNINSILNQLSFMKKELNEKITNINHKEISQTIEKITYLENDISKVSERIKKSKKELESIGYYIKKLKNIKSNNKALVNQITTISKVRIKIPLNADDPLFNIVLPDIDMKKIENKLLKNFEINIDSK